MKKIILLLLLFISSAQADYTLSWTPPNENNDGSTLTDLAGYDVWCAADGDYDEPFIINDPQATSFTEVDPIPAGDWACKLQSFNLNGTRSEDSREIYFILVDIDGDGNLDVTAPNPPDPDDPGALRVNEMSVTRQGYWVVQGPDGQLLTKPDGGVRQVTSKDEGYEYISQDGRGGTFTLLPPTYEVTYE